VKCGRQNFDDLKTFVEVICKGSRTASRKEPLLQIIGLVDQHIRSTLRSHMCEDSKCKWHSYSYLFDGVYTFPPDQEEHCEACHNIFKLGHDIMDTIELMDNHLDFAIHSRENKKSLGLYAKKLLKNLDTYWTHKVRSIHEENVLQKLIDDLKPGECLIISDFKMKMQMLLYRESMVQFFGKRGFPWLGFMFVRKVVVNGVETTQVDYLDMIVDGGKEDGFAAGSMLEASLVWYKVRNPDNITTGKVITDGAGCFSGLFFFLFLAELGTLTGIRITDHHVSEAGCGKSPLDTHFAYCNTKTQQSVKEGRGKGDIVDAETTVMALQHRGGITNSSSVVAAIDLTLNDDAKVLDFKSLSMMHHREYCYDNDNHFMGVRLRHLSFRDANSRRKAKPDLDKMWAKGKSPGSLLCTLSVPSAASGAAKRRKHQTLTSHEKGHKKRIQQSKHTDKLDKANEAIASEEGSILSLQAKSANVYCSKCRKEFRTIAWRDKHEDFCDFDSGKQIGKKSTIIGMIQQQDILIASKRSIETLTPVVLEGSVTIGQKFTPKPQSCLKKTHPQSQHSAAVYKFVVFIHGLGEKNKSDKVTSVKAHKAMTLKGTIEGMRLFPNEEYMKVNLYNIPDFQMVECLDVGQIKSYMGKPHSQLKKLYENQAARENPPPAAAAALAEQEATAAPEQDALGGVEESKGSKQRANGSRKRQAGTTKEKKAPT
jgi:hypothetical protein